MTIHRKTIAHSFKKDKRRYYVPISSPQYISSTVEGILTDTSSTSKARGVEVKDLVAWKLKIAEVEHAIEHAQKHGKNTHNKRAKHLIKEGTRILSDAHDARAHSGTNAFQQVRENIFKILLDKTEDPTTHHIVSVALSPLVNIWSSAASKSESPLSPLIRYRKMILAKWRYPKYMFNAASGGHVSALRCHVSNSYFAVVDLKSFYETITDTKIYRSLRNIGLPHSQAFKLTGESTVKNGKKMHLPRGFHQSSILASLVFDHSLLGSLIRSKKLVSLVTVYNDDIVISASRSDTIKKDYAAIIDAAKRSNFQINVKKSQAPCQKIEVFNLLLSHNDIAFPESRIEKFISDMGSLKCHCEENGDDYFESLLDLHASYLVSINRLQFYGVMKNIFAQETS